MKELLHYITEIWNIEIWLLKVLKNSWKKSKITMTLTRYKRILWNKRNSKHFSYGDYETMGKYESQCQFQTEIAQ
jgi:hypothetical protein